MIVPPCINKYYILDLQPENSFVRWAVGEGHTVFMLSWRNIPPQLGRITWDDYLEQGVLAALGAAREITGSESVNALGFCVGGTLLACALAVAAARGEPSVGSLTLLTTMLDFADPGDIGVYVSRDLLAAREPALMAGQRIHGSELAGAFASLRANDLVWNYVVSNYLKGETPPAFDLLHWNGDSSNLPGPMFATYLKNFYLDNKLRESGALTMAGEPIDLARLTMPACIVASREDHIVPWRSAYRSTQLLGGESVFVLGASGHIAGVVNPPEKHRRNYWTNARQPNPRTTGSLGPRRIREAGGRTGASGSHAMPVPGAQPRARRATPGFPRSNRRRATTCWSRPTRVCTLALDHRIAPCAHRRVRQRMPA